ncbi:MAG: hypothetical protein OXN17_11560 [Candidatus Poribacteria bacterium]|nr:hypothetical protein [Candidatus Poribacteria bacterium]MDE0505691.1 hypothetical protein [Candidatus Poribacteria bacterium]
MPSTVETELVEVFQREVEELSQSTDKYASLEPADIDAILRVFHLAIVRTGDGVTPQKLFEAICQRQ